MEQDRKSLGEIFISGHGKRASSSGGASPLPLFHFLFLVQVCVQSSSPPAPPPLCHLHVSILSSGGEVYQHISSTAPDKTTQELKEVLFAENTYRLL